MPDRPRSAATEANPRAGLTKVKTIVTGFKLPRTAAVWADSHLMPVAVAWGETFCIGSSLGDSDMQGSDVEK